MLDRIKGPDASAPEVKSIPPIKHVTLGEALPELFLYNQGDQQVCKIELVFPGGKLTEQVNGASMFTSKMIFEGSKERSAEEIHEFFDFYGAFTDSASTLDDNQVTLYCQSNHLKELIPDLIEII